MNPLDYGAVEANDPAVIPAPEIDPTAIVYIPQNEVPYTTALDDGDYEDGDSEEPVEKSLDLSEMMWERLKTIDERQEEIYASIQGVKTGVNTIGEMMNSVAEAFDQIMQKVQQGGLGSLLGGFMGGKKDD